MATAILCAAFAAFAPSAAHANYSVRECNTSVGNTDAAMIRPFGGATKISQSDNCGNWGLRMEANGQSTYNTYVVWQWTAPPNTIFKTAQTQLHYYTDGGYGPMTSGSGSPGYSARRIRWGTQWVTPVQSNSELLRDLRAVLREPLLEHVGFRVHHGLLCGRAGPRFTFRERFGRASRWRGGQRGPDGQRHGRLIRAVGRESIVVYVNGIRSASSDFCGPDVDGVSYSHLKPCPDSSGPRAIQLDTEHGAGWVNGANEVRICGYDVGGNESQCLRRTVQVDNSCARFRWISRNLTRLRRGRRRSIATRAQLTSNDNPVIRGSLTDGAGNPVAGAAVCVYQTTELPDAGRELATTVTTQANGRFATRLDAGPSRTVDLVYRYNTKKVSDRVELDSTVVPTLKFHDKHLTNGQAATFFGQLPGPNAEGRAVALQARVGRKWRTFKQVQTGHDGRFRGKYRFTQTVGRVRYVFRALVKSQSGYPYEPGASRKRKLVVRG